MPPSPAHHERADVRVGAAVTSFTGRMRDRHLDLPLGRARPYLRAPRGREDACLLSAGRASRPLEDLLAPRTNGFGRHPGNWCERILRSTRLSRQEPTS